MRRQFEGTPADLRAARRFVAEHLPAHLVADAELLVSELASNAVMHVGSRFEVDIVPAEDCVRVEVIDPDPTPPTPRRAVTGDVSGRGLHIVDRVSSAWGCRVDTNGKCVWFELRR
ncbi:MAG: ATP-binding protein [Acidimicrobiales bacterium]